MLFLGNNLVYSIGQNGIADAVAKTKYSGSVYVKNSCLTIINALNNTEARDGWMQRPFDLLNYSGNQALGGTPDVGGFEVEATFISTKESGWGTLWGCRVGTSGRVTRMNILISSGKQVSTGLSILPSANPTYGESLLNRKVTIRFIVLPTTSDEYLHAYSGRIIVKDAETDEILTDETEVFGDNAASDAMFSNYTTFWSEPLTWFYRASSNNPNSIGYGANGFEGYFFGARIYVNPLGIDTSLPTRIPVITLTPVKGGQIFNGTHTFSNRWSMPITKDGIAFEVNDVTKWSSQGVYNKQRNDYITMEMQVTQNFQSASNIVYMD